MTQNAKLRWDEGSHLPQVQFYPTIPPCNGMQPTSKKKQCHKNYIVITTIAKGLIIPTHHSHIIIFHQHELSSAQCRALDRNVTRSYLFHKVILRSWLCNVIVQDNINTLCHFFPSSRPHYQLPSFLRIQSQTVSSIVSVQAPATTNSNRYPICWWNVTGRVDTKTVPPTIYTSSQNQRTSTPDLGSFPWYIIHEMR